MLSSKPKPRRNLSVLELKETLKDEVALDINGWEILGDVMVLELGEGYTAPEKKLIGETIIRRHPKAVTVVNRLEIGNELRQPVVEVLAGDKTQTIYSENGCRYNIDPTKVMFSFGNKDERMRMAKISSEKEVVVDMFSCVGQFAIPIAKHSKPKKVFAIEKNPFAFEFLKANASLNKLSNLEPIHGDCRAVSPKGAADRVVMGYIFDTLQFIPTALQALKNEGVIHYHFLSTENKLKRHQEAVFSLLDKNAIAHTLLKTVNVKSYAPKMYHYVMDLSIQKN